MSDLLCSLPMCIQVEPAPAFDITCLQLDSSFQTWFNGRFGSAWNGKVAGHLTTWSFVDPGIASVFVSYQNLLSLAFEISLLDFTVPPTFFGNVQGVWPNNSCGRPTGAGYPGFMNYSWDHNYATFQNYFNTFHPPQNVLITPCDTSAPPSLAFINEVDFTTPSGSAQLLSQILKPDSPPIGNQSWTLNATICINNVAYDYRVRMIIDGLGAYGLIGIAQHGSPISGYAEFDPVEAPSVGFGWPVGKFVQGNARGLSNMPPQFSTSGCINVLAN